MSSPLHTTVVVVAVLLLLLPPTARAAPATAASPPLLAGTAAAVTALIERVLPGQSSHFELSLNASLCPHPSTTTSTSLCFALADGSDGRVAVTGTTASELSAGVGFYLREHCNMSMGWARGGGSVFALPAGGWPAVGAPRLVQRAVPWTFVENICTSSYTLVWHTWPQWEAFLDWAALWGINIMPALAGQEEIQYKVFRSLGLDDLAIRNWFNGPALLSWSRGQNGHGAGIMGPLPRSWMTAQWTLQRQQILPRMRDLGIIGQLPAFQGNVPWALAGVLKNSNITQGSGSGNATGWMDSRDPNFASIADNWMSTMLRDFGPAGHVYQMDSFFERRASDTICIWDGPFNNTYLHGCPASGCREFDTLAEARVACEQTIDCNGLTVEGSGRPQLRAGARLMAHGGEVSYTITNNLACRSFPPDPDWLGRGIAGYQGVARSDPDAVWLFQGWALYVAWPDITPQALSQLQGFINAAPPGKFVIIDMSGNGDGQWREWQSSWQTAAAQPLPFVWTSLHTFGGADSLKGNLTRANRIPFDGLAVGAMGAGFTPEGFDQNPAYYELLQSSPWRSAPLANTTAWLVDRAHRRYRLGAFNADAAAAWALLGESSYSEDLDVTDETGVGLLPGRDLSHWEADLKTPTAKLCKTWAAWGRLLAVAPAVDSSCVPTYRYDLVNTGREVLAQLSTPLSVLFMKAVGRPRLDAAEISATGTAYVQLLRDLDALVATAPAFQLKPWLAAARSWGVGANDCNGTLLGDMACEDFYEWNARVQITTWYPTPRNGTVFGRDNDYARKHWAGLVGGYYAVRAEQLMTQALADAKAGRPLDQAAVAAANGRLAYEWSVGGGGEMGEGEEEGEERGEGEPDFVQVSGQVRAKHAAAFAACG